MKKGISSLELTALVNELQFLAKGKISQIYHKDQEVILQLHATGEGKQLLKIIPGKYLSLTHEKESALRPSGFCMQLRKYLSNAFIKSITQRGAERIVVFEFEKKETFYLIVELFSKGNVVLTDKDYNIISVFVWQKWKDRTVKPKEIYKFPEPGQNWKKISEQKLIIILKNSEKRNLATCLATELNLGGVYAEEVLKRIDVDKNVLPKEGNAKKIIAEIKKMIKEIKEPKGYIYDEDMTPIPLQDQKENSITKTYNEAISTIDPFHVKSPYEKKIAALKNTIAHQEEAIAMQEQNIDENTQKGELIYEKYQPLQKLLDIVKEMKKTKEWNEIETALKKEKKIQSVDLKNKKVAIEL
ncbi:hypothetical protein HOD05_00125 [Candidatus Woesearchaeota archaeon]|mgnify:FL=1|jgi:predicted ribosome quality control (RQC) complex YloA/Tae2 family protein|nr:hypothetical protein [Candidatus Woesearchaeota archaeon]MBT4150819.1 hypothetical protein [Candidatus Woesearchaeota archaeon]MBT4246924.1 hypothetical protein [Candidatus Woesearchaeota archaeon]MBT4433609.1 hypothetical protein [Candidatus Woesearchaeota archaeon]MBT7331791.1 hypothetical protein [Candidatus Woesearchaeota archaeon]